MTYVSFDPASIKNLGWSIVNFQDGQLTECQCGTFLLPEVEKRWQVLGSIWENVETLFINEEPDLVILEQTSAFKGGFVTAQVSQCIGAILILCLQSGIEVEFTYPTHVKKILTGKGKATKTQIRKGLATALSQFGIQMKYDSEHASDALGNIISWLIDKQCIPPIVVEPVKTKKGKKNGKT